MNLKEGLLHICHKIAVLDGRANGAHAGAVRHTGARMGRGYKRCDHHNHGECPHFPVEIPRKTFIGTFIRKNLMIMVTAERQAGSEKTVKRERGNRKKKDQIAKKHK